MEAEIGQRVKISIPRFFRENAEKEPHHPFRDLHGKTGEVVSYATTWSGNVKVRVDDSFRVVELAQYWVNPIIESEESDGTDN